MYERSILTLTHARTNTQTHTPHHHRGNHCEQIDWNADWSLVRMFICVATRWRHRTHTHTERVSAAKNLRCAYTVMLTHSCVSDKPLQSELRMTTERSQRIEESNGIFDDSILNSNFFDHKLIEVKRLILISYMLYIISTIFYLILSQHTHT